MKSVEETLVKIGTHSISDAFKELLIVVYAHFHLAEYLLKGNQEKEKLVEAMHRLHKELQLEALSDLVPDYQSEQANTFLLECKKAAKAPTLDEGINIVKSSSTINLYTEKREVQAIVMQQTSQ